MEKKFIGNNCNCELKNNYLEKLDSVGLDIMIYNKGLKITTDPLFLANCVKKILKKDKKISDKIMLDIGAGQGILGFLLYNLGVKEINCIEIQPELYEILEKNINELTNNKKVSKTIKMQAILGDIKNHNYKYNYIISNPPYKKINSGNMSNDTIEKNSKFETLLQLEDLIKSIHRCLLNFGEFFIVIPNYRLNDLLKYIYAHKMRVRNIFIKQLKKNQLIVVHGVKGGEFNSDIKIHIEDSVENNYD